LSPFAGSNNSRFFALLEDAELLLMRTDSQVWKRRLEMPDPQLIGIGNSGTIFIRSAEGIPSLDHQGRHGPPLDAYKPSKLAQTSSYLGGVFSNIEGTELCMERITPYTRLSAKIFSFISPTPADKGQTIHEIIFYQPEAEKEKIFKFLSSSKTGDVFFWSVSRDFEYLIVGEAMKASHGIHTRFSLISVSSGTIQYEFNVGSTKVKSLAISCDGTALIDLSTVESPIMWLMSVNGDRHIVTPPPNARLLHLGRDSVAVMTERPPAVLIKDFHDRIRYAADLRPLEEMGITYEFLFTTRDDIDFLTKKSGQYRVVHSNVESFETDAKRWEMLAQHQKSIQESKNDTDGEIQRILTMKRYEEKTKALASSTQLIAKTRSTEKKPPAERLRADLENLSLKFFSGQITEESYQAQKSGLEAQLAGAAGSAPHQDEGSPSPFPPPPPKHGRIPFQKTTPQIAVEPSIAPAQPPPAVEPPRITREASAEMASFAPSMKSPVLRSPNDAQRRKIESLIEALEERFILGEMSEASYIELRDKYRVKLKELL